MNGRLLANGGDGGVNVVNGGGGSGGAVYLDAPSMSFGGSSVVSAAGGRGDGTGTVIAGGNGGLGRIRLAVDTLSRAGGSTFNPPIGATNGPGLTYVTVNGIYAGDVIVADGGAGTSPAVFRVNPATGARTVLSSGGSLAQPRGVAIAPSGDIYVLDGGVSGGAVFKLDPATGAQTLISSGNNFVAPWGITVSKTTGDIYVADAGGDQSGSATDGKIIQISGGTQTVLPFANTFVNPRGITSATNGDLYVADSGPSGTALDGRVTRIRGSTPTLLASGGFLAEPWGIALTASDDPVVADAAIPGAATQINASNAQQTVLSSGNNFVSPQGVAVEATGDLLVVDSLALGGTGGVIRVDHVSHTQTPLTAPGTFAKASGIAVVPARADLTIAMDPATPNPATIGQPLTYRITVGNNGPATATGVAVVDDPLPPNVVFQSAAETGGGTCGNSSANGGVRVTCTLPSLASQASAVVTIVVRPLSEAGGTTLSNTATVSGNEINLSPSHSATRTAFVTPDTTPPTLSPFTINGSTLNGVTASAVSTTSQSVKLNNLTATDDLSPTRLTMQFSNDGATWSAPQPLAATADWTLAGCPAGVLSCAQTVSARVLDPAGNISSVKQATIQLETGPRLSPPQAGVSINDDSPYTNSQDVHLTINAPSFAATMEIANSAGFTGTVRQRYQAHVDHWPLETVAQVQNPYTRIVYVRYYGIDGQTIGQTVSDDIILDTTPPQVTVRVLERTSPTTVNLQITAQDVGIVGVSASGMATVKLAPDNGFAAGSTINIAFPPGGATVTQAFTVTASQQVCSRGTDVAGNETNSCLPTPALAVQGTPVGVGGTLGLTYTSNLLPSDAGTAASNWVGLYPVGGADRDYLPDSGASKFTPAGTLSGPLQLQVPAAAPPGQYELRLFTDRPGGQNSKYLVSSPTFAVAAMVCATPQITVSGPTNGRLQVAISLSSGALTQVTMVADSHVPTPNALIDALDGSRTGLSVPPGLQAGASSYGFWLYPSDRSQAVTVPLQLVDSCGGRWSTLVGGGASIFRASAPQPPQDVPVTRVAAPPASAAAR